MRLKSFTKRFYSELALGLDEHIEDLANSLMVQGIRQILDPRTAGGGTVAHSASTRAERQSRSV